MPAKSHPRSFAPGASTQVGAIVVVDVVDVVDVLVEVVELVGVDVVVVDVVDVGTFVVVVDVVEVGPVVCVGVQATAAVTSTTTETIARRTSRAYDSPGLTSRRPVWRWSVAGR
jgi:hypothetical protein